MLFVAQKPGAIALFLPLRTRDSNASPISFLLFFNDIYHHFSPTLGYGMTNGEVSMCEAIYQAVIAQ
ncbi:hypothetical protein [Dickeya dadantii]|uniref:hypothetical protein n=1 Tax=Dickeya dadantii TaxID=204038 RepID=UPI003019DA53